MKIEKQNEKVFFESDGKKLAALLFKPENFDKNKKYPAVIVTRPASGVKEQTAGLYAQELSKKGFITLAFDPKGYGESEGRTRVEDTYSIISDTKNGITFMEKNKNVDVNNIFNAGICLGSAYATVASIEDKRIKATGVVSPIYTNPEDSAKIYGGKFMVTVMFNAVKPIVWFLNLFGVQMYIPLAPLKWYDKLMPATKMQKLAPEYYGPGKVGDVPTWSNKVNFYKSETAVINFEPFDYIEKYNAKQKPYFMAYSTGGCSPTRLQEFYDKLKSKDKEVMVIPNSNHFDLYYKEQHVNKIVKGMSDLFKRHID